MQRSIGVQHVQCAAAVHHDVANGERNSSRHRVQPVYTFASAPPEPEEADWIEHASEHCAVETILGWDFADAISLLQTWIHAPVDEHNNERADDAAQHDRNEGKTLLTRRKAVLTVENERKGGEEAVEDGAVESHVDGHEEDNGLPEEHLERLENDALQNGAQRDGVIERCLKCLLFHSRTFLEDGFLVCLKLRYGVEAVKGGDVESHPFEEAEILLLADEATYDRT